MNRNKNIDGLKGLSMLMVMAYHIFFRYPLVYHGETNMHEIGRFFLSGIAVPCFMIISGLFMWRKFSSMKDGISHFVRYIVFRIWPAYAVSCVLIFLIVNALRIPDASSSIVSLLLNITMVNGFIGVDYIDGAHWYLTALISASAMFTIMGVLKGKGHYFFATWMLIAFILEIIKKQTYNIILSGLYVATCSQYMVYFATGVVLHQLVKNMNDPLKKKRIYCNLLVIIIFFLLTKNIIQTLQAVVAMGLVLISLNNSFGKIFGNKVLIWFGGISYSTYLIHQNISYAIMYSVENRIQNLSYVLIGVGAFIVSLCLGAIMTYVIERPITNRLRK